MNRYPVHAEAPRSTTSTVKVAAYRAATRLREALSDRVFDYRDRHEVIHAELLVPEGPLAGELDRERLWNETECGADHRPLHLRALFVWLTLPALLPLNEQAELARAFAQQHFLQARCAVDLSIHRHGHTGAARAHLMIPRRSLAESPRRVWRTHRFDDHGSFVRWQHDWDQACARAEHRRLLPANDARRSSLSA